MARPEETAIAQGSASWDAVVNQVFDILFNQALPLPENYLDKAALEAARPAGSYAGCLATISDFSVVYYSDGTTWEVLPAFPVEHASTHQHGGSDEIATSTPSANSIPKTGAGTTLGAGWIPTASEAEAEALTSTSKVLTPANLRSVLVDKRVGSIYHLPGDTPVVSSAITSAVKLSGGTTLHASSHSDFSMPSAGRIQYNGSLDRTFAVTAPVSGSVGTAVRTVEYSLALNGTVLPTSVQPLHHTVTDLRSVVVADFVTLSTGDYLELFGGADSSTNITLGAWKLLLVEI